MKKILNETNENKVIVNKENKITEKQENEITVIDVAQYLINHRNTSDFTKLKVTKLAYFAYCKYLVDHQKPLFENDFEAWLYGPVSTKLFFKLSYKTRNRDILSQEPLIENFNEAIFSEEQKQILNYVLQKYGKYPNGKLVELTQKEGSPWDVNFWCYDYSLNIIEDEDIIKFYSKPKNSI